MINRPKALALLALIVVVTFVPFGSAQAQPLKRWCRVMEGTSRGRTCTISSTAIVDVSLDVPPNNTLSLVEGGIILNYGTIGISGTMEIGKDAILYNYGRVNNLGTVFNHGTIINCVTEDGSGEITGSGIIHGNASTQGPCPA